jgi:hypothetical protein
MESYIAEAIRKRKYTTMLSLDISKAYDTCWWYAILKKLKKWKFDGKMLLFITNFTKGRSFQITVGNTFSTKMNIENGIVQEAVINVTIFLIGIENAADKVIKWTNENGFRISAEKTKSMLIHRRNRVLERRPRIINWINNVDIEMTNHHRILGLIFGQRLNWRDHIKDVKARAMKKMNIETTSYYLLYAQSQRNQEASDSGQKQQRYWKKNKTNI